MRNFDLQIPYRKVFFQHAVLSKFLGLTLLSTVSVLTVKNGVFILQRQSEEKRCLTLIHRSVLVHANGQDLLETHTLGFDFGRRKCRK